MLWKSKIIHFPCKASLRLRRKLFPAFSESTLVINQHTEPGSRQCPSQWVNLSSISLLVKTDLTPNQGRNCKLCPCCVKWRVSLLYLSGLYKLILIYGPESSHTNESFRRLRGYNFKTAEPIRQPDMKREALESDFSARSPLLVPSWLCRLPFEVPACLEAEPTWVMALCSVFSEEGSEF